MRERHLELVARVRIDVEPRGARDLREVVGHPRHAVLGEEPLDEVAVLLGDQLVQVLGRGLGPAALAHVLRRDDEVDAVGLAAAVLVDPAELDVELLGVEREHAEDAVPAGLGHGGDHVAAVREGEDRELDAEAVADGSAHAATLCSHMKQCQA